MRSLLLALLAATAVPACTQDITGGGGGGGDDQQGASCGNGTVDQGETCDDGNTNNGDGCSSSCQNENTATPRVAITVDNPTLPATDLGVESTVTVTLTSMMGFAGDVTLAATAADTTSAPITDWTLALDATTVTVAADGTATAHLKVSAMGDAAMLAGKIKITATSGSLSADTSVDATFNPELRVEFTNQGTQCEYPINHGIASPWKVKMGRKIAVYNAGNGLGFIIHANNQDGFNHENQTAPGTLPGNAYVSNAMTGTAGDKDVFYCHDGVANTLTEADQGSRNYYELTN